MAIVINTVFQSLDSYPEPKLLFQIDSVSSFFSVVFIFELTLKLTGLGFKNFFADAFNLFDCVIVASSCVDVILTSLATDININALTALRTFRLIRIFKLARTWR